MACRDSVTFTTLYLSNTFLGRRRLAKINRLAKYTFSSVFLDFLWIQPTDFDIALSVASSDTKESIFEADMVPQIRGTKFERDQGRVVHGDFGRDFGFSKIVIRSDIWRSSGGFRNTKWLVETV